MREQLAKPVEVGNVKNRKHCCAVAAKARTTDGPYNVLRKAVELRRSHLPISACLSAIQLDTRIKHGQAYKIAQPLQNVKDVSQESEKGDPTHPEVTFDISAW